MAPTETEHVLNDDEEAWLENRRQASVSGCPKPRRTHQSTPKEESHNLGGQREGRGLGRSRRTQREETTTTSTAARLKFLIASVTLVL
ncbi:hypothetical protein PC9H_004448 [Pleurotus ostreatus]|uniref:Uncharacterized protein n=1 Tax=Pleurotus ostreatus TaxID=5322 RepID=A0A8H7A475_PLEOS|nr:uncharacterized protein PC9H_004448 [Pleurotus ostreatus]KAF7437606.1 hypothetical protein PC9H_004448 [Pleurotus ostreatus]